MPSSFSVHRFTRRKTLRLGLGSLCGMPVRCATEADDGEFSGFADVQLKARLQLPALACAAPDVNICVGD